MQTLQQTVTLILCLFLHMSEINEKAYKYHKQSQQRGDLGIISGAMV